MTTLFEDEHVRRYEETDGEVGEGWENAPTTLILTTTGRRTGAARKRALVYQDYDGAYVVVASRGGADRHPDWYFNLLADPDALVQVMADKFPVRARTADGAERAALWAKMTAAWPDYEEYQSRTQRQIPVVVLERV
ncbi:nitroreductase family deazaflavin-dependent oxidoreductase [Amycolatopsis sp. YIM 10]|uniref:nitroreductase family deazaflavin-dependent oxidoreductase n=1 Tax=Amycolatopsis sp. YIM 10 TaxID=2653857 RepID=UPI0012903117|nr:nitroreductase family deazaflavin-dependent oxidoreductase [Amycolatopsis sp. YIM 10]QFU87525.1 Deazaflavin-dependent nitroreductase [Amycolatopsis sp. YIM 10]